ncbi:hypothetical protein [Saccharibacillus sp. JS10]|uniref:hypothetical protein n=1 Tax=Saccharibacillus sp. JS10 TaxID=2950552 RepID=UPI00210B7439|nr:hypothetical protein [Saccharibacillus sp. JS10]MCQ4087550.1 hypothetical protein [Saccharibacillus sp. JS10]
MAFKTLIEEFFIHREWVNYWANLLNEDFKDIEVGFPIALLMKGILDSQESVKE